MLKSTNATALCRVGKLKLNFSSLHVIEQRNQVFPLSDKINKPLIKHPFEFKILSCKSLETGTGFSRRQKKPPSLNILALSSCSLLGTLTCLMDFSSDLVWSFLKPLLATKAAWNVTRQQARESQEPGSKNTAEYVFQHKTNSRNSKFLSINWQTWQLFKTQFFQMAKQSKHTKHFPH